MTCHCERSEAIHIYNGVFMADKIQGIANISYDTSSVSPVRGYKAKERTAKIEAVEEESKARLEFISEKRAYLAKFPTPKGATFADLLDKAMGKSKKIPSADDDEGYVLGIQKI